MPRDLALSNGRLHVALDDRYEIRDLYWPHVGHDNHAVGSRSRFGVSTPSGFSWVGDKGWRRRLAFADQTLVTECTLRHAKLGVTLHARDAVIPDADVLVREVTAEARGGETLSEPVDLFFHLDLRVNGTAIGDTCLRDSVSGGLAHYKRDRWFLQNATRVDGSACGRKASDGLEGTWKDAEDGTLSGNPVAHGACDGVLQVTLTPDRPTAWWWLAVGPDAAAVRALDAAVAPNPSAHLRRAETWWRVRTRRGPSPRGLGSKALRFYRQSLAVALANVDHAGGILAANDSDVTAFNTDTYSYVWPRDGAFVAHALDLAGHHEPPKRFLRYLARVIEPDGWLAHKFTVDGLVASTWHPPRGDGLLPVQEDETALAVWAFAEHVRVTEDYELAADLYHALAQKPCEWMLRYRRDDHLPLPSWDPWEERWGVHAYTTSTVIAALEAASELADRMGQHEEAARWRTGAGESRAALEHFWSAKHGRYARRITGDEELDATEDASLVMLAWLPVLRADDKRVRATLDHVFERLTVRTDVGGVARYVGDEYQRVAAPAAPRGRRTTDDGRRTTGGDGGRTTVPLHESTYPGNPWPLCTLWHADWLAMSGRRDAARERVEWVLRHARPSGVLAEQVHPLTGKPLSVAPLTWSHAAFIETLRRFTEPTVLRD